MDFSKILKINKFWNINSFSFEPDEVWNFDKNNLV